MGERIDLREKLGSFSEHWVPKVVAELNGQYVKVAKFQGEYVWHQHADEDELFLVLKGRMRIRLRDGVVELSEGQLYVVPRGVEHRPEADEEVECLLFEPAGTRNTGDVDHEYTIEAADLEKL